MLPNSPGIVFGLEDQRYFSDVLNVKESMAVVQKLQLQNKGNSKRDKFVDHTAQAFMRFSKLQLRRIKKCQLQVHAPLPPPLLHCSFAVCRDYQGS